MTTPVSAAVRCALRAARALNHVQAVYRRGAAAVPIEPLKSTVEIEHVEGDGMVTVAKMTVWRLPADELVLQGEQVQPQDGDLIEEQVGATLHRYEVQPVTGEHCYDPIDPDASGFKIQTRLVKTI